MVTRRVTVEVPSTLRARSKVGALLSSLGSDTITLNLVPGTAPEDVATLEQFKTALSEHIDITWEIIPLEIGEDQPNERNVLVRALGKSILTDNMIVNFIFFHCGGNGHPGALVTNRMAAISLTDRVVESTNYLKAIVHEYKKSHDLLGWEVL